MSKPPFKLFFAKLLLLVAAVGCMAPLFVDSEEREARRNAAKSIKFVTNRLFKEECSSCHLAFLPGFLPKRSWLKLMNGLEDHFGENAALEAKETREIKKFLLANAADSASASLRSRRIAHLISPTESPLRITETPFWVRRHFAIKAYVFEREKIATRAKCEACHDDAQKGLFSEYDVHIPR